MKAFPNDGGLQLYLTQSYLINAHSAANLKVIYLLIIQTFTLLVGSLLTTSQEKNDIKLILPIEMTVASEFVKQVKNIL